MLEEILKRADRIEYGWGELFSGKFRLREISALIHALVEFAEAVVTAPASGDEKHRLVREAFDYFDRKYHIVDRIDDMITLPFFLEPFDGKIIRTVVDFLIVQTVTVLNRTIWKLPQPVA